MDFLGFPLADGASGSYADPVDEPRKFVQLEDTVTTKCDGRHVPIVHLDSPG